MTTKQLSALAANVATKAAHRRLVRLGWAVDAILRDAGPIADEIKKALDAAWPAAMADAEQARAARMFDAAAMTLEASFALAGIAAADAHHAAAGAELVPV